MKILNITPLMNALERSQLSQVDRPKIMQLMLAMSIAWRLPMATSPLKSEALHYADVLRPTALDYIDAFNESYVVDVAVTEALVRQFWIARYRSIFCPENSVIYSVVRSLFKEDTNESGFGALLAQLGNEQLSEFNYFFGKLFEVEGENNAG